MTIGAWKYQSDTKQAYCFRGYVERYEGNRRLREPCEQVRKTKGEALRDAKRLLNKLEKIIWTSTPERH